jgi:hypothetical protein
MILRHSALGAVYFSACARVDHQRLLATLGAAIHLVTVILYESINSVLVV